MEAVVNLQRLADWSLLRARAHRARGDTFCLANVYRSISDTTLYSLLPQVQVDRGKSRARNPWVEEGIRNIKHDSLDA